MLDHFIVACDGRDLCMRRCIDSILVEAVRERRILIGRIGCIERSIFDRADRLTGADVDAQPNVLGHDADVDGEPFRRLLVRARLWALHSIGVEWLLARRRG